ncbi:hypothetical protein [Herbaspirillum lusitanum]|uniref:hypothetical protein n=1 Tax=Herbaspirillum lusitanum TaxID=213312 RepID=UPI001EE67DDF|nr:hypothetical protein [Herbaspirillum lusitanum]
MHQLVLALRQIEFGHQALLAADGFADLSLALCRLFAQHAEFLCQLGLTRGE